MFRGERNIGPPTHGVLKLFGDPTIDCFGRYLHASARFVGSRGLGRRGGADKTSRGKMSFDDVLDIESSGGLIEC